MWSHLSCFKQLDDSVSGQQCLYCSAVIIHMGNHRNVHRWATICWEVNPSNIPQWIYSFELSFEANVGSAHRYHLLFLALLGQVLDAIDKKFVGADIGSAGLNHPTAQLHQLVCGGRKKHKNNHLKKHNKNVVYLKSQMFYTTWC